MEQTSNTGRAILGPWPHPLDHLLALLWLLGFLAAASNVRMTLLSFMILAFSGLALAGVWGLRALAWILLSFRAPHGPSGGSRARLAWLLLPATLALALALAKLDLPLHVRLALSETRLRAVAEGSAKGPVRAGLFRVRWVEREEGWVALCTGTSFLDSFGLACSRDYEAPQSGRYEFRHLRGPWWAFVSRD